MISYMNTINRCFRLEDFYTPFQIDFQSRGTVQTLMLPPPSCMVPIRDTGLASSSTTIFREGASAVRMNCLLG